MKFWIPLAAVVGLVSCGKEDDKPRAAAVTAPKAGVRPRPAGVAPEEVPPAPAAPPAVPATEEEMGAFTRELEDFERQAGPLLKEGETVPELTAGEIKALREAATALLKSRAKLLPGLTVEQKREFMRRTSPVSRVVTALNRQQRAALPKIPPRPEAAPEAGEASAAPEPPPAAAPAGS